MMRYPMLVCRLSSVINEGGDEKTLVERQLQGLVLDVGDVLVITWKVNGLGEASTNIEIQNE